MLGSGDYLPPRTLQLVGIAMLGFFVVFWAFTDRLEPLLLATAGGLIGGGAWADAYKSLRKPVAGPPPVAVVSPAVTEER